MRAILQKALGCKDLTGVCLCGPKPTGYTISQKEILSVRGAILAAGHDPSLVVEKIRKYDGGKLSSFDLDPELGHYGVCVPIEILILFAEGPQSRGL